MKDTDDNSSNEIERLRKISEELKGKLEVSDRLNRTIPSADDNSIAKFKGIIALLENRLENFESERKVLFSQIITIKKNNEDLIARIRTQSNEIDHLRKKCASNNFRIPILESKSLPVEIENAAGFPFSVQVKEIRDRNQKTVLVGASHSNDLDNSH